MKKNVCLVLLAAASFAAIAAFGENVVTPRYYVGDSLVAMYDGVYNATNAAGAWVHDASATNWLDLSGNGRDFTVTSGGSWTATTFEYNGPSATLSPRLPYYRTQEIRCQVDSGRWVLVGSEYNGLVLQGLVTVKNYTKRFQTAFVNPKAATKWLNADSFTAPFTTTVTYGPLNTGSTANYCNATATPSYGDANSWSSTVFDGSTIGYWSSDTSFNGKGRIQSIRLYDRELTTAEIARNYMVDRVRFEGATLPEALEPAVECVQTAGGAEAGGALISWTVFSFGWLGSSLDSFVIEYSATSDFASSSIVPVVTPAGATRGFLTLSGLEPGATYYARALSVNNLGAEAEGTPFTFTALQNAGSLPIARLTDVEADLISAEVDVEVPYTPAGFDVLAALSRGGETYTNVIAKGVSSTGTYTWAVSYLTPGTDYAVELLVRYGGEVYSAGTGTFTTSALTLSNRAYVQNGLLMQLDGIFNAVAPDGHPFHDASATNWTDLTGNVALRPGGAGAEEISFVSNACVFPASKIAYLEATNVAAISDAILSGTFTVEAAFKISANPASSTYPAIYSFGSGSGTAPRTLCFDMRNNSGKYGAIQYNASAWTSSANLNQSGLDFRVPSTTVVTGGGAGQDARFSLSGTFVKNVTNSKKYTTASNIDKKLRIRYYDNTAQVETTFHGFRVYGRTLSGDEIIFNNLVDEVRFRGADPPQPIEPSVSLLCLDAGVEGAVSVNWMLTSAGWSASSLAALTMEYSESPDFNDAVSVTLGTDIAESGSTTLSGLVPGETYWARGVATNDVGTVHVIDTFSFRASSGANGAPVFSTTSATASSGAASFDLSLVLDGGAPCDGYAVLSHDGHVSTNALFSGASAPVITTLTLAPLAPGCSYTAVIAVTNGLGGIADEVALSFTTAPDDAFVNPYVDDGLIGLFDGIFNTVDGAGKPIHHSQPDAWTDLKGNFPTVTSGTITYSENGVTHIETAATVCNSAVAAVNAILSGSFTVETLCRFASRSTTSEHFYALFSFGSGYYEFPRVLCMDTRLSGGLYGAVQYNCSAWNSNAMMLHELDFTKMATYSVVGGGSLLNGDASRNPAALYVNGEYTNAVPNNGGYTPQTVSSRKFSIHRYNDNTGVSTLYHSFRIYDRPLTAEEVAANRVADEVRFLGRTATLNVASATRAGQALSVTLVRSGALNPADIIVLTASEYGRDTERATESRFEDGDATADVTVELPAGTAYVRFKAGGLVSPLVMVNECAGAEGYAIATPFARDVGASSATLAATVSVPDGGVLGRLSAAYGYAPDALVWTNALVGAGDISESGMASGLLPGLKPSRTYYCRLFGTGGGETVESDTVARFTTADAEDTPDTCIHVVATNRVDGVISSLTVEIDSERATELWLFGDLADRGVVSNGWAYAEKICDVPAGGGTFNVSTPAGWGTSILAFRLGAGLAQQVESVSYAGTGYVPTDLMPRGAFRIDLDFAAATATAQQRVFSLGSAAAGTLIAQLYRNDKGQWAYAWNLGDGNWEATGVAADTNRHSFTIDGASRFWAVDDRSGTLRCQTYPGAAVPEYPLSLFGHGVGSDHRTAAGTLWSCQVRGADGKTLLGDFIPVVSGGEACLYDFVSRRLLFPSEGSFTAGAAVDGDVLLVEPTAPFLYASAADVEIGTDVVVTGNETGDTLTFSGTSRNAEHVTVNGHEATLSADGTWTITITNGIVPGVPYECRILASAGDEMDILPVFTETTLAASQLYWNTPMVADQRTITFSGKLSVSGANDTTVRLLTGPSADALTNTLAVTKPFDDNPSFTLVWHPPVFDEEYFWAITIENAASNPANGHWFSSTATNSFFTRDAAVYTWQAVDGDWSGDWSDPAHWDNDKDGDILGWPQTPTATAFIPQGTVNADTNVTVKTIAFGNDGPVTLMGFGGRVLETTSYGTPYNIIPNGAEVLITGDFVLNLLNTLALGGKGANLTSYAASFTVADGTTFTAREVDLAFDGVFRVRDASVTLSGIYFHHSNSDGTPDTAYGTTRGTLRIEGTSPLLTVTTNLRGFNNAGSRSGGVVEFLVPRGGYARTPIVMTGTGKGYTFCGDSKVSGNSKALIVRIADDSPLYGMGGTVDLELVTWRVQHTDGAALVDLVQPRGADRDPKRRIYITDDDLSLRLQYHTGHTVIMVR